MDASSKFQPRVIIRVFYPPTWIFIKLKQSQNECVAAVPERVLGYEAAALGVRGARCESCSEDGLLGLR